jgi:hypothetical protein
MAVMRLSSDWQPMTRVGYDSDMEVLGGRTALVWKNHLADPHISLKCEVLARCRLE